jgi:hypothetical protein
MTQKNRKKVNNFHLLKCWMFFFRLKTSLVDWTSFMLDKDKQIKTSDQKKVILYRFFFNFWPSKPWRT